MKKIFSLFFILFFSTCSSQSEVILDREGQCKKWKNSFKEKDLMMCELSHLYLGDHLDSLIYCAYDKIFTTKSILCVEVNNEFEFSPGAENCSNKNRFCVETKKKLPDENCRIESISISGLGFVVKKTENTYEISKECGDFPCSQGWIQHIDYCAKRWLPGQHLQDSSENMRKN